MARGLRTDVAGAQSAAEAAEYWARNYPGMGSIERNCQLVAEAGYVSMDGFVLPEQDWWNNYYEPAERRVEELREKYADDPEVLATLDETQPRARSLPRAITTPTATSST